MRRRPKLPQWPPRLPGLLSWLRWRHIVRMVLVLVTVTVLTVLVFTHLDLYQFSMGTTQIRAGQPAPHDIIAPESLIWEEQEIPVEKPSVISDTAQSPVWHYDADALPQARQDLDRIMARLRMATVGTDAMHAYGMTEEMAADIRAMEPGEVAKTQLQVAQLLDEVMTAHIEPGVSEMRVRRQLETVARQRLPDEKRAALVAALAGAVLRPTWVPVTPLNTRETAQSALRIAPRQKQYHRGEVIIAKGDIVTRNAITQLTRTGLLTRAPLSRIIPIAAIIFFAVVMLGVYLRAFCAAIYANERKLVLLVGLIIVSMWAMLTLGKGENASLVGLITLPAGVMAIAGLLGTPAALVSAVLISVTAGFTADQPFAFIVLALGSSLAGIMAVASIWPASRIIPAFFSLVAVNMVLLISLAWLDPTHPPQALWAEVGMLALCAVIGAFSATALAIGAIYLLARPFGITTHYRLMELATNSNEPVLRRMMAEAPGTYHSSVMVANMAEAAADAIGADALLTRVAALYHDIGKLKRPAFFVENQAPLGIDNVHQKLLPKLSYLILASHVRDGVECARQYRLPEEVMSIIREHHGTTLAAYFYHRAITAENGDAISEHDFRYPGPKPSSRESAVVMLADSVQASVKSLKEPTPSRIEDMVREVVQSRLDDGQFEDCDITLRDIMRITEVFIRILSGLYTYSRIEYPEIKRGMRGHSHSEGTSPASQSTPVTPGN